MAEIKKIYDDAERINQILPETNERAVYDDNGTPLNNKLGKIIDLINQKQMEVGSVPSDLTPTKDSNNWVTSGGIYENIYAPEETNIFENTSQTNWNTGNISNGSIVTTYANKYQIVNLPSDYDYIEVYKGLSSFNLNIAYYNASTDKYVYVPSIDAGTSATRKITVKTTKICLLLWDKPTDEQAQAETITVNSFVEDPYIRQSTLDEFIETPVFDVLFNTDNGGIVWYQGGISLNTGYEGDNTNAIRSGYIKTYKSPIVVHLGLISGDSFDYNVFCVAYDEDGIKIQNYTGSGSSGEGDVTINNADYIRICHYSAEHAINPSRGGEAKDSVIVKMNVFDKLGALEQTYSNPVLKVTFADPTVWNGEDGYFYALSTGNMYTKPMYRSANLINWEDTKDLPYTTETAAAIEAIIGNTNYWAPCVVKIKSGQWNLYLSAPSNNSTHRGIVVLKSSHPTIGYEIANFFTATFGDYIDPCIARDEKNRVWMFAGSNAKMFRRQLTDDGLDFAENSEWVHVAGLESGASGNINRIKTFEGAYLYRRQGYWYLFCSSGRWASYDYAIRVVRSATIDGNFVDKSGNLATDGYAETIMSTASNNPFYGPGHNAEIITDKNGKTWMPYHCHWIGMTSNDRPLCLDEVLWDENGWPYFSDNKPSFFHSIPNM